MDIIIDSGIRSYSINGCEVRFNPTDMFFMERLYQVFSALEEKSAEREMEINKAANENGKSGAAHLFELSRKYDREMREMLDEAVGAPLSAAVAGQVNIYAANNDDIPLYVSVLFALMDQMDESVTKVSNNTNTKVQKYLTKYQHRYHK